MTLITSNDEFKKEMAIKCKFCPYSRSEKKDLWIGHTQGFNTYINCNNQASVFYKKMVAGELFDRVETSKFDGNPVRVWKLGTYIDTKNITAEDIIENYSDNENCVLREFLKGKAEKELNESKKPSYETKNFNKSDYYQKGHFLPYNVDKVTVYKPGWDTNNAVETYAVEPESIGEYNVYGCSQKCDNCPNRIALMNNCLNVDMSGMQKFYNEFPKADKNLACLIAETLSERYNWNDRRHINLPLPRIVLDEEFDGDNEEFSLHLYGPCVAQGGTSVSLDSTDGIRTKYDLFKALYNKAVEKNIVSNRTNIVNKRLY
jgi:hypothetical protein